MPFAIGSSRAKRFDLVPREGLHESLPAYPAKDCCDDVEFVPGSLLVNVGKEARYSIGRNEVVDAPITDARTLPIKDWREGIAIEKPQVKKTSTDSTSLHSTSDMTALAMAISTGSVS